MENNNISRRDFLKDVGIGTVALGAAAAGCSPKGSRKDDSQAGKMELRTNPATGDKVSLLGYGCMRWRMKRDENGRQVIDQDNVNELVDYAMAHGVNYYDTSPAYLQGQSEEAAGIALSRYPRKDYYIATKLSNFGVFSREGTQEMYYKSFEQLRTDYFDYYLLHAIGRGGIPAFNERYVDNDIMSFLLAEREAGRIRQLGFSFHGMQSDFDDLMKLYDKYHWDFVQIEMNYMDWKHADPRQNTNAAYLYEELDKREIPITVMEPLLGGRLARVPENVSNLMKTRDPDATVASWAFRFVGSHPRVLTALSGMTYMENLVENVNTFSDFKPMNEEELEFMDQLAGLMAEYPMINCNNCQYCMPCPYGVDIPGIFMHYNSIVTEGKMPLNKEQREFRKLRRNYLTTYSKAIESLRQADHCIGCHQCIEHCPQSISIPEELQRIDQYIEKLKQDTL
ncbi:MAG: aldo/keto reductase [Bacteroidales bacterium]|nr:aldo/keto reductase [Bacteroidales bacterium]MBR5736705.1 aldo/keto reductase [Bacteroidales bacterium]